MVNQTSQYFDIQRYVVIAFVEMKIHSMLVFDKHSNELIGFADLGEEELNDSSLGSTDLVTHALVFFVRDAATDLKYSLIKMVGRVQYVLKLMARIASPALPKLVAAFVSRG